MAEVTGKKIGLFDKFYAIGDDALKALKKIPAKNALKRKFHAAYDALVTKAIDTNEKISKLEENLETFTVDALINAKWELEKIVTQQRIIKEEYKEFFLKEMKVTAEYDDED